MFSNVYTFMSITPIQKEYISFLTELKQTIQTAQVKAVMKVNTDLISMYWKLGTMIIDRQSQSNWWDNILWQIAKDLKKQFPDSKGFSLRNLIYMKKFALCYSKNEFVQQPVAQISRSHNIMLMQKLEDNEKRFWYAKKSLQNGRSRNVLAIQIDNKLYERQWKAITNFTQTLPAPESDLVQQALKDPYSFDFLTLSDKAHEKDIEKWLVHQITSFLLELWKGFAFVGKQYKISVEDNNYYLDLLFYHLELRCFVVIDLKTREFKPEDAGKMNFYLNVVNDKIKHQSDNPSIWMILCKDEKWKISEIEYALSNINQPIGVSEFNITDALPEELKSSLPTIEELEFEFEKDEAL